MAEQTEKTKLFITKAIVKHGDKYDYSKVVYGKSQEKVIIICKIHREFEQISANHIRGQGCSKCAVIINNNNRKSNTEDFVEKSIIIHSDKYDYSKVVYGKSNMKVTIICKIHGEFEQRPCGHLNGQGCSKCGNVHSPTTNEFIEKAMIIHCDKYDYSKVIYIKATEKIIIICKTHGEFEQQPCGHLFGHGCTTCGTEIGIEKRKSNTTEFLTKANKIHGDKYDYSKTDYTNCKIKITIICKIHEEFEQLPSDHLNGHGCTKCAGIINGNRCKSNTTELLTKANKIHGDKYDYSKLQYINSYKKVKIICKIHGEFEQSPTDHLSGRGCKLCANTNNGNRIKSNTTEFITKAKEIHGDKYDYSKVDYSKALEKIIIICKMHGEFEQQPSGHLTGYGCNKCAIENNNEKRRSNTVEFIEKSNKIHDDKYDYSKTDYINSTTKVTIICKKHSEYEQTPSGHLSGHGCNQCAIENNTENLKCSTIEFIEKATNKHGYKYDYSKVNYTDFKTSVIIICSKHNEFIQRPDYHLHSNGCPKCACNNYSKSSIKYLNFMEKYNNIQIQHAENGVEHNIKTTNYHADGYCEETNTIYEFHGDFWHGNPKIYDQISINKRTGKTFGELYQKTLEREKQIKELGYNLVVIWEQDWNRINKSVRILQQKIKKYK